MKPLALVLSCEHAVNTVPKAYYALFAPYQALLKTHRGIDFGALALAMALNKRFNCDFVQAKATRLLIDCNRSLSHRQCFSEVTRPLPQAEKTQVIQHYYLPFRQKVEHYIKKHIEQQRQVLHLSTHSFTPLWKECQRHADLGLLYDPKRLSEATLARGWREQLRQQDRRLKVRMNYPYRGSSDGFTTALRKQFAGKDYLGIEIEVNQSLIEDKKRFNALINLLSETLKSLGLG